MKIKLFFLLLTPILFFLSLQVKKDNNHSIINKIEFTTNDLIIKDSIYFYYNVGKLDELILLCKKKGYENLNDKEKYYLGISVCQKFFLEDNDKFNYGHYILKVSCQEGFLNSCAYLTYYDNIQFEKKYHIWEDLARKNSDVAMFFLGTNSPNGDPIFDTNFLIKSCNLGNIEACDKISEYFNSYKNDTEKRIKYLLIGDSLGSYNAKFNLSLLRLKKLINVRDSLLYNNFLNDFYFVKYSKYPEYVRYFEYGKILYESNDVNLSEFGESLIITSSACGLVDAKDYMKKNNIVYNTYKVDFNIINFEIYFLNSLKEYIFLPAPAHAREK